ncbi:MAG: Enoyl-CoA hydratase/isomerase [Cyanobacteria bacterium RYN_339]|nr:Enoyl-CoA hydratase/isomerase [Cyanobacteria bacterium RYN_339]
MTTTPDVLLLEKREGVAFLTLNRADRMNAFNMAALAALRAALDDLYVDREVRAVIVTGAGEKAFCAGADLKERAGMSPDQVRRFLKHIREALTDLENLPKPVIAAVNGIALGGGTELALACDIRLAADTATMGLTETTLAIIPGGGGTQRLPRLVGAAKAKEIMITGRQVRAEEALRIGLVDEVVPAAEVLERALAKAAEVAAGAVIAQAYIKAAVDEGTETTLSWGVDREQLYFVDVFETDDAKLGVRSFLDNGPGKATFTGQ